MRRRNKIPLPTINKAAVAAYLARPFNSYDFLKDVPHAELLAHVKASGHRLASDLWHNQLTCLSIGMELDSFLFFLKMGGGKTTIALELMRYRKRRGELLRALVLVPENMHVSSWEEQIQEHAPDLTYTLLEGTQAQRERALKRHTDICVLNYPGLQTYMTRRMPVTKNGKTHNRQVLQKDIASEFAAQFNFVTYDELHRVTDHTSLYYDMFRWLSFAAQYRYALTGSPFGRNPEPLWGQFYLMDHGETLGDRISTFRQAFFLPKKDYWSGIAWRFNKEMTPELHRVIKHRSITYELKELQDVPRKVRMRIPVHLTGEGAAYYKRILTGVKEARGDYRSLENLFVRMRQCASGFLSMKSDDESRIEFDFKENPKLDALLEFMRSRPDEKILIFHEYRVSGKKIEQLLTAAKIDHAVLHGGMKDGGAGYQRFLKQKSCRAFVLQNQLGSEAINPQYVCRRLVFYESPTDPKRREQAEGRVERPGQNEFQFIHDLVVVGTVEEKVLGFVKEGRDLLKAVLSGDATLDEDE